MNETSTTASTYVYREDGYEERFEAASETDAEQRAEALLREGDHGTVSSTLRLHARLARIEDGEEADSRRITAEISPGEPPCTSSAHDWRDGQPYGSGGGVTWTDTCAACGLMRTTDTWAACQDCGETYARVSYEPAD